jgi:hypothetical protein
MNEDVAQLVREGLDRLAEGATVPPELAARARRQHHYHRKAAIGWAMTATAAAAAVIAVVAVNLAAAPPAHSRPDAATLDAAIVTHTEQALAASARKVVQARSISALDGATTRIVSWSDSAGSRTQLAKAGQPPQAAGYVRHGDRVTFVTINYRTRTFEETTLPEAKVSSTALPAAVAPLQTIFRYQLQSVTRDCGGARSTATNLFTFSWAAYIRQALRCGIFKVAGHGTVEGHAATKLVANRLAHVPYSAVLWVGRASYLPLRLAFVPLEETAGTTAVQIDLRWLPATAANRAKAAILPAPHGFTKVAWGSS